MLKAKVLIEIKGGLVEAVYINECVEVYVANMDTEGMDSIELMDLSERIKWPVDAEAFGEVDERLDELSNQLIIESKNI